MGLINDTGIRRRARTWFRRKGGRSRALRLIRRGLLLADGLSEIVQSRWYFAWSGAAPKNLVPQFLGIGAQKAATTWLDSVLRMHADLQLPHHRKEIHYFDRNRWKGDKWYLWHFRGGEGRLRGEITPAYSTLTELNYVSCLNNRLKIIFILRNPVERAWSMARMDLADTKGISVEDVGEQRMIRHIRSEKSRARGSYASVILRWQKVFGKKNLFIGFTEEILEDPVVFLSRLLVFLDVDPSRMPWEALNIRERVHAGSDGRIPKSVWNELSCLYFDELSELHKLLDSRYTWLWLRALQDN